MVSFVYLNVKHVLRIAEPLFYAVNWAVIYGFIDLPSCEVIHAF